MVSSVPGATGMMNKQRYAVHRVGAIRHESSCQLLGRFLRPPDHDQPGLGKQARRNQIPELAGAETRRNRIPALDARIRPAGSRSGARHRTIHQQRFLTADQHQGREPRWFVPLAGACHSLIVPAVTDTPDSAHPVSSRAPPMRTSVVGRPR